jgi:uncharacterized protein (TIGR02594 family)
VTAVPSWLFGALEDADVVEVKGDGNHPRILEYHSYTGKWSTDEVPWCGSAVETWLVESDVEGLGRKGALARSWGRWGRPEEALGAITVIKRRRSGSDARTGSRGGYHVGLLLSRSRGGLVIWSGNAGDRVGADFYSLRSYDLVAMRMPLDL